MEKRLNANDRAKLDEYLTSVREVEQTVSGAPSGRSLQAASELRDRELRP